MKSCVPSVRSPFLLLALFPSSTFPSSRCGCMSSAAMCCGMAASATNSSVYQVQAAIRLAPANSWRPDVRVQGRSKLQIASWGHQRQLRGLLSTAMPCPDSQVLASRRLMTPWSLLRCHPW